MIGLALDEPDEDDEIFLVNGIKVAVDPSIEYEVKSVTVDFNEKTNVFILINKSRDFC